MSRRRKETLRRLPFTHHSGSRNRWPNFSRCTFRLAFNNRECNTERLLSSTVYNCIGITLSVWRRDYDVEIEGLKRETLRAQEEHEGLVAVRDRLESDRTFIDEQLGRIRVSVETCRLDGRFIHWVLKISHTDFTSKWVKFLGCTVPEEHAR